MPPNASRPPFALVAAALALVGALALLWWNLNPPPPPVVANPGASPASPVHAPLSSPDVVGAPPLPPPTVTAGSREAVQDTEVHGSLLLHVVWGDDKQPAVGLGVRVWRPGADELFDQLRATTDDTGTAMFAGLAPGNVYPQLERGRESEHLRVAIVAGERAEATLVIEVGMNCRGRVVDGKGAPVADAEIVFSDWGGGRTETLTHSAADGTFTLRAVRTHCHLGARKAGMKPSSLRQFTAAAGATVEFTIVLDAIGGALAGVVLAPDGEPVAGAIVRAGNREQGNHKLADGASAMSPQAEYVQTDEHGRFLFASVVPGPLPVAARARELAPWQDTVEVTAGRREELTIRLQPGATLFGTVRDTAGAALPKVEIMAGDWDDLGSRRVRSGDDGSFRISGLAAGALPVRAEDDTRGKVSETLQLTPGEERRWDPVLTAGLQLRGCVRDPDGKPVAKVMVEGQLEQGSREDHWFAFESTDAEGRFVLNNCKPGKTIRLSLRRKSVFPELVKTGVLPGPDELDLRLPKEAWVWIQGTVLGPDGEVLPNVHASPFLVQGGSGSPAETADGKTGAFRYGPYPPGTYGLHLTADGFPPLRIADRTLGDNETWDLGELRFQRGGTLVVHAITAEPGLTLSLSVYTQDGARLESLANDNGVWRSGPLPVGSHALHVAGVGVAARVVPLEIRAGQKTELDVPIATGAATTIECVLPAGASAPRGITLLVRDEQRVVWRGNAWAGDGPPSTRLTLLPGTYTVEASVDDLRGSATLVVGDKAPATAKLELRRP